MDISFCGITPENHTESNFYFNSSASSKTAVSVSNKNITFAYQDSLDNKFIASLVKKFNLKNIVDAFDISDDYVVEKGTPYTVTFSNPAVYKDGHVYRIHHYHYDYESGNFKADNFKEVKEDTVDYTAKDGKITVTLHGASPILVEDVTPATNKATTKAQGSKAKAAASSAKAVNGRKAALNTGVRY